MFKLFDGYSATSDKINRKTDEAVSKMLGASKSTDQFNDQLDATGASAGTAAGGLKKLIGVTALLAATKKGMDIADEYTNTSARLDLINDGLQTQAELQDKIFASADRAKGAYTDMASAISKMGLLAGDQFKSNDELIAFTELIQKSFKVGGASSSEQSSALLQLTQAMSAGKLQGDEFRSIMENAPMIADAIAKFTGKSKGELKEMSADGTITSEIIIGAMFAMADEINGKFEEMPMTFADIWNKIKNGALQAFAPIIEGVNTIINSAAFNAIINSIIVGVNFLSSAIRGLINIIAENWPIIQSILMAIGIYLAATLLPGFIKVGIAGLISGLKIAAGWIAANAPMITMIATIAFMIYALSEAGVTAEDVFGAIGGTINVIIQFFKNLGLTVANIALGIGGAIGALGFNIEAAFHNSISSVQSFWYDMLSTALTVVGRIAEELNKLPFIEFDYSGITSAADDYAAKAAAADKDKKEYKDISEAFAKGYETFDTFEEGWAAKAYQDGQEAGTGLYKGLEGKLKGLTDKLTGNDKGKDTGFNFDDFKTDPITVKGTGKNDGVKVDMSDEDLQYLRDIAEREYINQFSTATLAPTITVSFGDVHEEADADKVQKRIRKILQEEIAMAAEGG